MASTTNAQIGVLARPFTVEGVDPSDPTAQLPPDASTNGVYLNIPLWDSPSIEAGNSDLLEIWVLEPGVTDETRFYSNAFPVPVTIPARFHLPPQYLQREGEISLRYRVTLGDNGNEDTALPQRFTLKRQVPTNLAKPVFPNATPWGYFHCCSVPRMWVELLVRVPAQPGRFSKDDECVLDWEGFYTLNAVRAIPGTVGRFVKTLTEQDADSPIGFDFVLGADKFEQYIAPMGKKEPRPDGTTGSAKASYTLYRGGIAIGRSTVGLAKFDRVVPGESFHCDDEHDTCKK
ncbi:hypothetical protein JFU47_02780 [Pseudomonas sp. TH39(2020)]|uniref:Uncharacterized protein n=1 Tax=Pseudomonas mandelii TaxID=75612 RepID=A0A502IHL1_9PSED|nr:MULTISPECIES: hypothetical protein [Pseudomonas]MBK5395666.1 hypothetical protein [Pseudomonas sp. TH39(2020)]TPG84660.1 hypothetical protein EAH74_11565 [Pseudomonas mandelii]TPG98134.1 hypothetical protein EAH72_04150 [Pseudomonas caspiana]